MGHVAQNTQPEGDTLDSNLAARLRVLRQEQGWSLEALAERCGVSRSTLSRIETAEVSPTAAVLGRLGAAYGLTMSRLMALVEPDFAPLVRREEQALWRDPASGYLRRQVSPPAATLGAEVIECEIPAGTRIDYDDAPRPGLEHHLYVTEGALELTLGAPGSSAGAETEIRYRLREGDCLRYKLTGSGRFETPPETAAHYILVLL